MTRFPLPVACLLAGLMIQTATAWAATGTDPDWPCIQRKQPNLSLGQIWTGPPVDEAALALSRDPQIRDLAQMLEQRRLPLDQAEAQIAAFAEGADATRLAALMQAIFQRIEADRGAIIAGIARYGRAQQDLSARIEDRRARMDQAQTAAQPDFDAIDAEEEALDWDQRIFLERQQSLSYVCETPVLLEQRIFALGRMIAAHLVPEDPVPADPAQPDG